MRESSEIELLPTTERVAVSSQPLSRYGGHVKTSSIIIFGLFLGIVVMPQLYLIATGTTIEAAAGRLAIVVLPLMFGCLWFIGLVGSTIERIIKGRG